MLKSISSESKEMAESTEHKEAPLLPDESMTQEGPAATQEEVIDSPVDEASAAPKKPFPALLVIYCICLSIGTIGLLLVWFNTNVNSLDGSQYFAIVFSTVLFGLSRVDNVFIPTPLCSPLRQLGFFLFISNIDSAVCEAHSLFTASNALGDEIRTLRAGTFLVLVSCLPGFLAAFFRGKSEAHDRPSKIRIAAAVFVAMCFGLAQILTWAVTDVCQLTGTGRLFAFPLSPLLIAIFGVATVISADPQLQDISLFFMINFLFATVPIFDDLPNGNQSKVGRAEVAFFFMGTLLFVLMTIADRVGEHRRHKKVSGESESNVKSPTALLVVQLFIFVLSIPAAVCVFARPPHNIFGGGVQHLMAMHSNYLGSLSVLVPLLNMVAQKTGFRFFGSLALLFTLNIAPMLAGIVASRGGSIYQSNSYFHAGNVMLLLLQLASALVANIRVPNVSIDKMMSDENDDESPRGQRPSKVTLFLVWLVAAAYSWRSSTSITWNTAMTPIVYPIVLLVAFFTFFGQRDVELQRLVQLELLALVCNPSLWPCSETADTSVAAVFVVLSGLIYCSYRFWDHPEDCIQSYHVVTESPQSDSGIASNANADQSPNETGGRTDDQREPLLAHSRTASTQGGTFEA